VTELVRDAPEQRRARFRSRGAVALVLAFALSLPAVTSRLYAADEIEYFAFLRSAWFDRDLSFDNEYRYFYDRGIARAYGFHHTFLELTSETGLRYNFGTVGSAILWAPMYAVADIGVRIARASGSAVEADGFSRPYLAAIAYGSALYGFLAVLLSAFVARRLGGEGELAAASVWIGTPLLFYMYLAPGFSHACSAFTVAAFVALWLVVRERWSTRGLMALGGVAALMTMVREQDAFFVAGVAVDFVWRLVEDIRGGHRALAWSRTKSAAAGALVFVLGMVPQAWAYLILNGRIGPADVVANKMSWTAPHALRVLLSPEHGFLIWTPLAIFSITGLLAAALTTDMRPGSLLENPHTALDGRQARRIAICLLVMLAAQVYITGSVDTWTVAGSFGQRRFVGTTVILAAGLALLLPRTKGWARRMVAFATVLSIWWNLGLMAQFGTGMMDRQRLEPRRNAYNAFVVVPRTLPGLAYRYLFDRSSFYRAQP
jgi:hypothetical protein